MAREHSSAGRASGCARSGGSTAAAALAALGLLALAAAGAGAAGVDADASSPPSLAARAAAPPAESVESSVVRVLVYSNPPDFFSPWQKIGTQASSGSGVIIDGHRILTNAHVVADAVGVEVKRAGSGEQYEAEVSFVGHDCDLALLTVSDERFFEGARPLGLGALPPVNAGVQTYGFPVGGETLSVTSGVI